MIKFLKIIFYIVCCFAITTMLSTQEATTTYTFPDGSTSITYNGEWILEENEDGSVTLTNNSTQLTLYNPNYLSEVLSDDEIADTPEILKNFHHVMNIDPQVYEPTRLEEILAGTRLLQIYPYIPEDRDLAGLLIGLQFSDNTYGIANALMPVDSAIEDREIVTSLLESFNNRSVCKVVAQQERTVQLRVGPGFNRGVFAFMPANREFTVLGQSSINGDIWWKLDKAEVAPESAALEVWVASDDVSAGNACQTVEIAATPGIIPPSGGETASGTGSLDPACPGATSAEILVNAWKTTDVESVAICLKNLQTWEPQARAQQNARKASGQCDVGPKPEDLTSYFASYWALADVATGYYIVGIREKTAGNTIEARKALNTVINTYSCAWAWDPKGWFWSLARAAREQMP